MLKWMKERLEKLEKEDRTLVGKNALMFDAIQGFEGNRMMKEETYRPNFKEAHAK